MKILKYILYILITVRSIQNMIFATEDAKFIKYYDSKSFFDGQLITRIAYDNYYSKIYCITVDTKNENSYLYFARVFENNEWKQINTLDHAYPYGDTLWIKEIEIDKYSRIWVTTSDGFLKYENGKWEKILTEDIDGLNVKSYKAILPDSLGNVFFQIAYGYKYANGITNIIQSNLYKYEDETKKTHIIYSCDSTNLVDNPEHLGSMSFHSYCADDKGNIWLASSQKTNPTEGNPKNKSLMRYNSSEGKYEFIEIINEVKNEYLTSITPKYLLFLNNSLWLVHGNSQLGGISKLDINSGTWSHLEDFEKTENLHGALTRLDKMVIDRDEAIWTNSTGWGLLKFDLVNKTLKRIRFEDILKQGKLDSQIDDIYDITKDGDGNNWFATGAGIVVLEGKKNTSAENSKNVFLQIYPNPAREYIRIDNYFDFNNCFSITNILGTEIFNGTLSSNIFSVESLPAGLYNIKIGNANANFIKE